MTQSGQGEEPSPREAREGIVLPSDGSEPLLPGMLGAQGQTGPQPGPYPGPPPGNSAGPQTGSYNGPQPGSFGGRQPGSYNGPQTGSYNDQQPGSFGGQQPGSYNGPQTGPYNGPQTPAAAPPGGQAWGTPWGPDQQQSPAPPPDQGWPTPPAQAWGAPDQQQSPPPDQWGAPASGSLPPEGTPAPSYGGQPAISQPPANPPLPPADTYGASAPGGPLPPAGHGGPAAPLPPAAPGAYGSPAGPGGFGGAPLPPAADEGATQYIPPVAAVSDAEGATQYIPPVAPGALPPEVGGGGSVSQATQFLGRAPHAAGSDSEATQYIPPVTGQAPYGMPQGGDRQPPAEFDSLFRSGPGGESPAQATQQMPRFQQPPPQAPQAAYATPGDDGRSGRGGRSGARVPLIAAIGVGIVVLGVGAGALLSGGGGDSKDKNQTVSATAPATDGSASASADPAEQQAVALDKLLADSGDSRASVIQAVASVKGCKNLTQAASDLRGAAKQRTELVTRLSGLSVDKLPNHAALTAALTKAWQASAAADNHYAAWADQMGGKKGCKKGQARPTGQTAAGNRESGTASQQKVKAAQLWNAIARTYGLTQRQPTQL